jgi:methylmalonyl-CoA/ethylmalonyl-CoA epimerase
MPRPLHKGARLTHVGIALPAIDNLLPFLRDVLHMEEAEVNDSDGAQIVALEAGEALIELMQASADNSPLGKYVARRGAGIHHICLSVEDIHSTLARCVAAGVRVIDDTPRLGAEGKRVAFLHPASTGGILIELSER